MNDYDCRVFTGFNRSDKISEDWPDFAIVLDVVGEDIGIVGRYLGCNCSGREKAGQQAVCRGQTPSGDNRLTHEFAPRQFTLLIFAQQFSYLLGHKLSFAEFFFTEPFNRPSVQRIY